MASDAPRPRKGILLTLAMLAGVALTALPLDNQLKKLNLIPRNPDASSILNLRLTDPGMDLEHEERHAQPAGARRI